MDSNWQLDGVNMNESSMRLISGDDSTAVCQGNILDSSSMWDQASGSQSLGFSCSNVHQNESSSSVLGDRLGSLGSLRDGFDSMSSLVWGSSSNDVLKGGGMFLPGPSGAFLPHSLPHFPADSGFIERAARYSCFSGGNLSAILSPFNANEASNTSLAPMQRSQEPFVVQAGAQAIYGETVPKNEVNVSESSKRVCLSAEPRVSEGCQLKNSDGSGRSNNEAIMNIDDPNPGSDEAGFSGQGDPVESESLVRSSSIGVVLKKRKRSIQDSELVRNTGFTEHQAEAANDQTSFERKGKQNLSGKNSKQGPQASDSPKEEYLHVRARRGQATNSHSLAERVRREKISERMKFLQDLVPGCNKVTGKAVMLDEIINYVQSLQRQVEFLSMKLATVNPQLDCNLERFLTDDILQLRAGPSSSLSFQTDNMPMGLPFHQSQGITQGLGNHADVIRRSMDLSLTATRAGFREPSSSHVNTSTWGDELHNAIQMGLISTAHLTGHDLSGSVPAAGHTKADTPRID